MSEFVVPKALAAQARRFHESGERAATPRLAATVMLLRPAPGSGLEVYVIRRATTMAFASGMYAFPGGSADSGDTADGVDLAGVVVRAAIREVAEETGVTLHSGQIVPWARWITPEFEPRRYDTYFFVVALPPGAEPDNVSTEADHGRWVRPDELLGDSAARMLPPTIVALRELAAFADVPAVLAAAPDRDADTPVMPRLNAAGTALIV